MIYLDMVLWEKRRDRFARNNKALPVAQHAHEETELDDGRKNVRKLIEIQHYQIDRDEIEQHQLTPEEREALATKDYGKLYALGAHPFTLWSFTEAVWVHEVPRPELVADYKAKAAKAGYPDFKT